MLSLESLARSMVLRDTRSAGGFALGFGGICVGWPFIFGLARGSGPVDQPRESLYR